MTKRNVSNEANFSVKARDCINMFENIVAIPRVMTERIAAATKISMREKPASLLFRRFCCLGDMVIILQGELIKLQLLLHSSSEEQ